MNPLVPYIACLIGAIGVFLLLRPPGRRQRAAKIGGMVLGLGAFAWLLSMAAVELGGTDDAGQPQAFFYVFSFIAVACAVRMITHHRPVFSALYFVLVVLSSSVLFLLLEAEFMAFALVIIYAGAILITYMFVLMLAQQADQPDDVNAVPEYDRMAREPASAAVVGFVMLALLSTIIFDGLDPKPTQRLSAAMEEQWRQLETMPGRLAEIIEEIAPDARLPERPVVTFVAGAPHVAVMRGENGRSASALIPLPADAAPPNTERVGLALVADFPASLELAGVILLMAMYGAVVLARKQIELGEDELREAAGMPRLGHDDEAAREGGTEA